MRAVVHAPANRVRVFHSVRTLLADESLDLEALSVVAHGGGVDLLVAESPYASRVNDLLDLGVDVAACRTSMARQDVEPEDLVAEVRTVPSGLGELVRLQQREFAYIRA